MSKKIIKVSQKTVSYKCPSCNKMVDVNRGKERIIETDQAIIHGWDYGHDHKRVFRIHGDEQILTDDYE